MRKEKEEQWKDAKAIYIEPIAGMKGIEILGFEYGIYDYVIVRGYCNDLHRYKLHYNNKGAWFRYYNRLIYYVENFQRVG